ncbi:uncharacterized protein PADG_06975 [Paracoccidioides brasiliensis Pb18]|uniref:Uncharacterized protein n=1 Tax=Paracoccidioides brasiliensis (strain Pb18) TaxID=502780 RepID=C1GI89_PARBD|nr:uncharacterized protein PADG_06975 [Paracoccidioides brasiliensis Pb18]EEH42155.1 hypothetical protein PADG_06975 [Paracoccidioides brasiliensis Pb18]
MKLLSPHKPQFASNFPLATPKISRLSKLRWLFQRERQFLLDDEGPFGRPVIFTILSRKVTALQSLGQSIHILNLLCLRSATHSSITKSPDRGFERLECTKISTSCRSGVDEVANSNQPKSLKQEVQPSEKQAVKVATGCLGLA